MRHFELDFLLNIMIFSAVAIYIEGIVNFLNMRANQLARGPRGLPDFIPMSLKTKIFSFFTDKGYVILFRLLYYIDYLLFNKFCVFIIFRRISPESKDRAVCYFLVLGLLINNYRLDFSVISNSLKSVKVEP